ncbi:hypothetical protein BJ322DRAFT_730510 [Thelephora terrestris]|uniref:C3H1-type domain-containing protein n=1 Tax=Thelephora terrestris TaxID=56493 RepID=A0A9P6H1U0_9AGAM|nr:hypothetical protein BJ322DRAFT_730510 [Thelephora terrestris]
MERPSTSKPRGICKYYETPRGCFAGKDCKFPTGRTRNSRRTIRIRHAGTTGLGIANAGIDAGFCTSMDPKGLVYPAPTRSALSAMTDRSLTASCHVLCVQCIRQWRHPNNRTDDAETTNISCPYCRVPSFFVTPSSQFYPKDHPRRAEIVAQYKASMARVPCRHFQNSPPNRRHCPFGRKCFYQHLNADGTPYIFPENSNPRQWIRARDLDDLSASLERLRRSIPEVFGNDPPHPEQRRRLANLALDVGRTLTRLNFPQPEVYNPLGILLAHHLTQLGEEQRDAAGGTDDNSTGDDQPRPEVADAILATSNSTVGRETRQAESSDDGEQGGESSDTDDGIVAGSSFNRSSPTPRRHLDSNGLYPRQSALHGRKHT